MKQNFKTVLYKERSKQLFYLPWSPIASCFFTIMKNGRAEETELHRVQDAK